MRLQHLALACFYCCILGRASGYSARLVNGLLEDAASDAVLIASKENLDKWRYGMELCIGNSVDILYSPT